MNGLCFGRSESQLKYQLFGLLYMEQRDLLAKDILQYLSKHVGLLMKQKDLDDLGYCIIIIFILLNG